MKRLLTFTFCFLLIICPCFFYSLASMDSVTINVPWERPSQPYIDIVERLSDGSIFVTEYVTSVPIDYGAGKDFVTFSITSDNLQIVSSTGKGDYNGNWGTWQIQRNINLSNDSRYSIWYREQTRTATGTATSNRYTWVNRSLPISSGGDVIGISSGGGIVGISPSARSYINVSVVYAGEVSANWELQVINALKGTQNTSASILTAVNQCKAQLISSNEKFDNMIEIMQGEPIPEFVPETNPDVSELDEAEGALLDDSFGQIEEFEPEPFNPSEGQLGSAFSWFKNELEFSTSNSKLRSSILVILSLSVVAFLFNILV